MSTYMIKLPDVGEGIAEAEIVAWHVNVGDTIDEDDVLVDVMTDKATVELPSPVTGTVTWLGGEVGDVIRIGSNLIGIDVDGQATGELPPQPEVRVVEEPGGDEDPGGDEEPGSEETPSSGAPATEAERAAEVPAAASPSPQPAAPVEPSPARSEGASAARPEGGMAATAPSEDGMRPSAGPRTLAAPAVRRRAKALGIDLAGLAGTGPDGRIEHEDLDVFIERRSAPSAVRTPAVERGPAPAADGTPAVERAPVPADDDVIEPIKVMGLRRNIAQRMQLSKRKIPHFTYVEEVDVTEVEKVRATLRTQDQDQPVNLTILPFLVRAVVVAIREFPMMNARFDDDEGVVQRHRAVHLGIATQTPKGLMVPVMKNAQARDLWDSAAEIARLSDAARTGRITLSELTGSTITITSLGALGGIVSTPVINYPEVAIIGVNKITVRPAYLDGSFVPRQMMNLSSSFDHRVVDGFDAAQFVQRIKALLETPALLAFPHS